MSTSILDKVKKWHKENAGQIEEITGEPLPGPLVVYSTARSIAIIYEHLITKKIYKKEMNYKEWESALINCSVIDPASADRTSDGEKEKLMKLFMPLVLEIYAESKST